MRLFHILLSIYILALSSLSCTDADAGGHKANTEISAGHSSASHEDETCSPFCICACCGSMAVHFAVKNFLDFEEIVFGKYSRSQEKNVINISFSVWQPPKTTC